MSLVVGFDGLSPDWPPTSMRSSLALGVARVQLTGELQREGLGGSSRGRGRCVLNITKALWQTRRGRATGAGCAGQGIDRRKHTRSKRQEAINESTQYTGFIRRLGDDEAWRRGGRGRNYAGRDDQRWKKSRMRLRRRSRWEEVV